MVGGVQLLAKAANPNIINAATIMYYSPTKLKWLHRQIGAKNKCLVTEVR